MAYLALRAFKPGRPPFLLLHIDTTWEFSSLAFRNSFVKKHGFNLIIYANEEARAAGINLFYQGDSYTSIMRSDALKAALNIGGYDVVFGGARRDEDRARAKEHVFPVRNVAHAWEPRQQRPEPWSIYNTRFAKGQSARVFPLSSRTENDIWRYILLRQIEPVSPYMGSDRPVVERNVALIALDDALRMRIMPGESVSSQRVRFPTLGCWPVTGAFQSDAGSVEAVVEENLRASSSGRQGWVRDGEDGSSLGRKKRKGYF